MPGDHHDTIVRGLSRPVAFARRTSKVEFIETHISTLFLTDDRVYKVKKAVDLGFVDFSTLERRRYFCDEECHLNRRLAPEIYLGVVDVRLDHEGLASLTGSGPIVDHAVEMRRLPLHGMLDERLDRGDIDNADIEAVVSKLVDFHGTAKTSEEISACGAIEVILGYALENIDALDAVLKRGIDVGTATQLAFLRDRTREFTREQRPLFERRVEKGFIRDGHGDLHAGNLCFGDDTIHIYDCIEFEPRFRYLDVASDIAFLAMDLDHRGYRAFSGYFVRRYAEVTQDDDLRTLILFYKSYRALVRAKVAALTHEQTNSDDDLAVARRYVELTCSYSLPPCIVLTCGLPGCGKSYAARPLAKALDATVIRSDVVRKKTRAAADDPSAQDRYSNEESDRVYQSLLESTGEYVSRTRPRSVIVDANFGQRIRRDPFRSLAEELRVPCIIIEFTCEEATIRQRLEQRQAAGHDPSEADFAVHEGLRERFEPPDEAPWRLTVSGEADSASWTHAVIDLLIDAAGFSS